MDKPPAVIQTILLAVVAYLIQKLIRKYLRWRSLLHIPGPNSPFLLGCFPQIRNEPFMEPHKRWWKNVGYDAPLLRYSNILGANTLLLLDPEIVKDVLMAPTSKDTARFYKPTFFLNNLLGEGLVTADGEKWMRHRKLVQPAFSVSNLRKCLGEAVPPKVERLVELWKTVTDGREIDLSSHLSALTLDVIGDVGFSHDFPGMKSIQKWAATTTNNSQSETTEILDPLINALNQILKPNLLRVVLFFTGLISFDGVINPTTVRAIKELNKAADSILENAKGGEQEESSSSPSSHKGKSVMKLLLKANEADGSNQQLDDIELRDELKTFLLAGHETTSTWCYWAIFALSKYPDIQEKVYQDVMKHAPAEGSISIEQAEGMEYFMAFMTEVLRFYPPVGIMVRMNRYDEVFAGHKIPPKTSLFVPIHLLHRHPKYWKDPDTFSPERWLGKDNDAMGSAIGSNTKGFTFLPFSFGGRNCIGYRFATMEAQLIMATIIRSLRLEIAPSQRDQEFTFTTIVTMKAKPSVKIVTKERM